MLGQDDRAYYALRADEEIQRGEDASTTLASAVHYELAYRYALLATQSILGTPDLTLIQGGRVDSASSSNASLSQDEGELLNEITG